MATGSPIAGAPAGASTSPSSTTMPRWPRRRSACSSTAPSPPIWSGRRHGSPASMPIISTRRAATSRFRPRRDDILVRPKNAQDGPTPAANGTLVSVLARLYALTGKDAYRERAERLIEVFSGEARRNPAVHCCAAERLRAPRPTGSGRPDGCPRRLRPGGAAPDRARRRRAGSDRSHGAARDRVGGRAIRRRARAWSTVARPPTSARDGSVCRRPRSPASSRTSWRRGICARWGDGGRRRHRATASSEPARGRGGGAWIPALACWLIRRSGRFSADNTLLRRTSAGGRSPVALGLRIVGGRARLGLAAHPTPSRF